MNYLISMLLLTISISSYSSDLAYELEKTSDPFSVLEGYFNNADEIISLEDFASEGFLGLTNCYYASRGHVSPEKYDVYSFVATIKGKPSNGPLFPGTADQEVTLIGSYPKKKIDRNAMKYKINFSKNQIEQTYFRFVVDGEPKLPKEISRFRKSNGMIFAQYSMPIRNGEQKDAAFEYGYCHK